MLVTASLISEIVGGVMHAILVIYAEDAYWDDSQKKCLGVRTALDAQWSVDLGPAPINCMAISCGVPYNSQDGICADASQSTCNVSAV